MFHRHHFFMGLHHDRPFGRGIIKYIILDHLKDKPGYGYEIIQALEERSYGFYTPSPGTVYPTLQMLEEMGYVTGADEDGKRVYTITDEGRRFLDEQKDFGEKIKSQMKSWWNPEKVDEIRDTMHEFRRFAQLLRETARDADSEKLSRIRKALAHAYEEISKDQT